MKRTFILIAFCVSVVAVLYFYSQTPTTIVDAKGFDGEKSAPLVGSTTVVFSQVYGGGGGGSTYLHDYVELKNISNTPQSLNGLSLMYGSATGQFGSSAGNIFALPNATINPGQYYLVELSAAGGTGVALPVTPDAATTNLTMSGTSGKVALVTAGLAANSCGATATPCTLPNANIVDLVSWGASNNAEGSAPTNGGAAITSAQGNVRKTGGCTETDNNNADFDIVTVPVPRNTGSAAAPCGGGGGSAKKIFAAYMNGANQVPPVVSPGRGYGRVVLNEAETQITASFYWENLTSATTDGHIHGPAPVTGNAGVLFGMTVPTGQTSGSAVDRTFAITPAQVADLKAGLYYFNVHSANFGGGEVRGQILPIKITTVDMDSDAKTDFAVIHEGASSLAKAAGSKGLGFVRPRDRIRDALANKNALTSPSAISADWYTYTSSNTVLIAQWGDTTQDFFIPADFDGDGKKDYAVWRPGAAGVAGFYIYQSSNATVRAVQYGETGHDPTVVADYDGDGKDDPATFACVDNVNPNTCFFSYMGSLNNPSNNVTYINWGVGTPNTFTAIPGDFDGDGKADFCLQRADPTAPAQGQFAILKSNGMVPEFVQWGFPDDTVLPNDYDGDGKTDFMIFRPSGGLNQHYLLTRTGNFTIATWGVTGDLPVGGDYDGDGKTDYAVWRPNSTPTFYVYNSSNATATIAPWGQCGGATCDLPVIATWNVH